MASTKRSASDGTRIRSIFRRRSGDHPKPVGVMGSDSEKTHGGDSELPQHNQTKLGRNGTVYNHAGHKVTKGIQPDGESGRRGFHPLMFLLICLRSTCTACALTNLLWPFTIAAMVLHFAFPEKELWIFITAYIGMIPAANLVGFAGQEFSRKLPSVLGLLLEVSFGSIVEIILFMVLIAGPEQTNIHVIQAAILGSILANLLLCLGLCFFIGGLFHPEQKLHHAVSEVGSNLMLVAVVGLIIPAIYYNALSGGEIDAAILDERVQSISHATAIVLLFAFVLYIYFHVRSHHGLMEQVLTADELNDHDRGEDLRKEKLTMTEAIAAVTIGIAFVTFMAIFLVQQIEYIHERGVSDAFIGLILVPVVEKAAEHLTAMDEAFDNQPNASLAHVLGASIQTALLNAPLVVIVGWGLGKGMTLNFEVYTAIVLVLAILVVGNFLRDEKTDYLEGALMIMVYVLIAIGAFYYPDNIGSAESGSGESAAHKRAIAQMATNMLPRVV